MDLNHGPGPWVVLVKFVKIITLSLLQINLVKFVKIIMLSLLQINLVKFVKIITLSPVADQFG